MFTEIEKKPFVTPVCEVLFFSVKDVITTSEEDWGGGDIEI